MYCFVNTSYKYKMKYIRMDHNAVVQEIIPAFTEDFPSVPIEERYSKDFLSLCLEVADDIELEQGWRYDPLRNVFEEWSTEVTQGPETSGEPVEVVEKLSLGTRTKRILSHVKAMLN